MIIRTIRINSSLGGDINSAGQLPGNTHDKATSYFRQTEACRILEYLGIPWKIQARERAMGIPTEAICCMTEEQHTLWQIASGDRWCVKNADNGMTKIKLFEENSTAYEISAVLGRMWQITFEDGTINFSAGDRQQLSLYEDEAIRWVRFPDYVNFVYPDGSSNIRTQLGRFPGFLVALSYMNG